MSTGFQSGSNYSRRKETVTERKKLRKMGEYGKEENETKNPSRKRDKKHVYHLDQFVSHSSIHTSCCKISYFEYAFDRALEINLRFQIASKTKQFLQATTPHASAEKRPLLTTFLWPSRFPVPLLR